MSILPLIYAPNPIFKIKAEPVADINDDIIKLVDDMFSTMYTEKAVGLGEVADGMNVQHFVQLAEAEEADKPTWFRGGPPDPEQEKLK